MIKTRKAKLSDSKVVYEWRNDELTRKMSLNTDILGWDEHSEWFDAALKNKDSLFLLCETENTDEKVALVHFSVISRSAFVSINLSPEMRGKRLSKLCLGAAINYFSNQYSQVTILNAEIKSFNIASQRVFESVGFFRLQENAGILQYECSLG